MLQHICTSISETILSVLVRQVKVRDDAVHDPMAYYGTIHRMFSCVLGIVAAHNLSDLRKTPIDLSDTFKSLDNKLNSISIFTHNFNSLSPTEKQGLASFQDRFHAQDFGRIELSDLYEMMLLLEFPVRDGILTKDSEDLNSIGSFYTPAGLSDKLVELTLDNYIFRHTGWEQFSSSERPESELQRVKELLSRSSFADHSCGTGSFLLAILRYFQNHLHVGKEDLKKVVLNFHAIEADPLSLEIAKVRVLEAVDGLDLYPALSKQFINGNPLIAPDSKTGSFDHCPGSYYHNGRALNPDQIQKCDVIVGNPPWGTVGFDLDHHLHILCPRLAAMDDEQQFDSAMEQLAQSHPTLYGWLLLHDEAIDAAMEGIYNDDRFEHSCMGGLQTNALFTELCNGLRTEQGSVGLILKGATLSDPVNKRLWRHLQNDLVARYDFSNAHQLFNIGMEETFSMVILGKGPEGGSLHEKELVRLTQIT